MKPANLLMKSILPILIIGAGFCGLLLVAMLFQTAGPLVLIGALVAVAAFAGVLGWVKDFLSPGD